MKITAKIFNVKGNYRFVFSASFELSSFDSAEVDFKNMVVSLFGECMYQIIQVEKL